MYLAQEALMDTEIAGQFGVETRHPHLALPQQHGYVVVRREHLDSVADALDARRADEHAREGRAGEAADLERRLEGVTLTAVSVAAHRDVDAAERLLVGTAVEHFAREQDHARARPEHSHAVAQSGAQRFAHSRSVEEP